MKRASELLVDRLLRDRALMRVDKGLPRMNLLTIALQGYVPTYLRDGQAAEVKTHQKVEVR
jgi:hypothetical protein